MRLRQVTSAIAYFTSFVLILCGLTYFFLMRGNVHLIFWALLSLIVGVSTLRIFHPLDFPTLSFSSAILALLFMLIVPRAITFHYIDQSAKTVSEGKYCYYQEGRHGALTRYVDDLSFVQMLQRGSRYYDPAHVALITSDRIWLWSFWSQRFVEWQKIDGKGATPHLDGRETFGRPPEAQIVKCWRAVGLS